VGTYDTREKGSFPMADIDIDREQRRSTGRSRGTGGIRMIAPTETRRSFMTTEFWLTLLAAAAVVIAGYVEDAALSAERAWTLATAIVVAYIVSRGIAKAGSHDEVVRDFE
jgi:hypothetical protein